METFLNEVTESTLNPSTSPAVIAVVHPVRVVLSAFVAVVTVGLADAVIVFATVGGKPEYAAFQISITIEPLVGEPASVERILHFEIVPPIGTDVNPLNPV